MLAMFKDSYVTQLDAWTVVEESASMPRVCYPALVGSGRLGVGLDAAGLQGLTDRLTTHFKCRVAPLHTTQSDLYVLHEGMISEHLYQSEVLHTGKDIPDTGYIYGQKRNFMPLGYLAQEFEYDGKRLAGDDVLAEAGEWRREWRLRHAIVRNQFRLDRRFVLQTEVFVPYGGETVYIRLRREALPKGKGDFRWTVRLPLQTRHGLPIYDEAGAVAPRRRTILAHIGAKSRYKPSEAYAVVYGVAADGMNVMLSDEGWTATMSGPQGREQVACLRLDFVRLAGEAVGRARSAQAKLEQGLARFKARAYERAMAAHVAQHEGFWSRTADIEVMPEDAFELKRRFMLHMSQYMFHCGNDLRFGGTLQFLLFHQNGWGASNFHDHQYVVDGIARCNTWEQAEANVRWMRRVMSRRGRAFPWMMTYDGRATVLPERDRAPMSDANRALLAMRIYELAGRGRDRLLRECVYPIVRRVADMALDDWFYEARGRMLFRGIETDIMEQPAVVNDAATVIMFLSVLRKAVEYSRKLGVDTGRRRAWQRVVDRARVDVVDGRYAPHLNAKRDAGADCWLGNIYYVAEAGEYLDDAVYARTRDYGQQRVTCNLPWIGFAAASSEMRIGRPDRAEQFFVDSLEQRVHGPGYFEEVTPVGVATLPPYGSAHGSHLVAACEQVVMSDFWHHRVYIGRGMPSKLRAGRVRFGNLRARDGLIVSGESDPQRLAVSLCHTGDPVEMEIHLRIPCEASEFFRVMRDGREVPYQFSGESVAVSLALKYGLSTELTVEG